MLLLNLIYQLIIAARKTHNPISIQKMHKNLNLSDYQSFLQHPFILFISHSLNQIFSLLQAHPQVSLASFLSILYLVWNLTEGHQSQGIPQQIGQNQDKIEMAGRSENRLKERLLFKMFVSAYLLTLLTNIVMHFWLAVEIYQSLFLRLGIFFVIWFLCSLETTLTVVLIFTSTMICLVYFKSLLSALVLIAQILFCIHLQGQLQQKQEQQQQQQTNIQKISKKIKITKVQKNNTSQDTDRAIAQNNVLFILFTICVGTGVLFSSIFFLQPLTALIYICAEHAYLYFRYYRNYKHLAMGASYSQNSRNWRRNLPILGLTSEISLFFLQLMIANSLFSNNWAYIVAIQVPFMGYFVAELILPKLRQPADPVQQQQKNNEQMRMMWVLRAFMFGVLMTDGYGLLTTISICCTYSLCLGHAIIKVQAKYGENKSLLCMSWAKKTIFFVCVCIIDNLWIFAIVAVSAVYVFKLKPYIKANDSSSSPKMSVFGNLNNNKKYSFLSKIVALVMLLSVHQIRILITSSLSNNNGFSDSDSVKSMLEICEPYQFFTVQTRQNTEQERIRKNMQAN